VKQRFKSILFLLTVHTILFAQVKYPGHPMPINYRGSKTIPVIDLSTYFTSISSQKISEKFPSRHKNEEFANAIDVDFDYSNSGVWDTLDNGMKIWRLALRSSGAVSINIIFTSYKLVKGVKTFVYDITQKNVLGAFTYLNNKTYDVLAIEPLPADMIVIEMQVPYFVSYPGLLTIGKVGHGFVNETQKSRKKDQWYGTSGWCNPDIRCYNDSLYEIVKRSVVRIVYAGQERCTGTLLTNTGNKTKNYVLTAGHCISNDWLAKTSIYYFDYESPFCSGPDGRNHKSVSGATLKATTNNKLDFSVVELAEDIPFYYYPFYAGWDASGSVTDSAFCIHHPWGDVKKIAIENDRLSTGNFGEGFDYNTHWLVESWEAGTTEKGSSGASLFDKKGRVIGDLSGGDAMCGSSFNDFFQKLSHSWNDYPDSANQLRYWLDPMNSGVKIADGFDPYLDFWQTGDTLSNYDKNEKIELSQANLFWGYISGHNSDSVKVIAEKYYIPEKKYLLGIIANVAKAFANNDSVTVTFALWNQTGSPFEPLVQEKIPLVNFADSCTSFIEFDSVIVVQDTIMTGFILEYNNPLDTFAVYSAQRPPSGKNTAFIVKDNIWKPMNDLMAYNVSASLALYPVVYDSVPGYPSGQKPVFKDYITIYPNPAQRNIWIAFKQMPAGEVTINLYDLTGRRLVSQTTNNFSNPYCFNTGYSLQGIYFIQVIYGNAINTQKLILIK
jgi:hypothetical protein